MGKLAGLLGSAARRDVPIGALTTYRVGGAAALFYEPGSEEDLERLGSALAVVAVPVLVLGKGSNLLVADSGWPGLCVRLGAGLGAVEVEGTDVVTGAAASCPVLARRSSAAGLAGMEWAVGIPGSVGGAVRMNAGGHGAETKDRLLSARVLHLAGGGDDIVPATSLGLSYRHSLIASSDLVVSARFKLEEGSAAQGAARIGEIVAWRRENQPGGQNAGSVFTNPPGDSAGRLVEAAGLKGFRMGTAAVSGKHANFIQADAGGRAEDVRRLVEHVRATVARVTGIELGVELRTVGWDPQLRGCDQPCS